MSGYNIRFVSIKLSAERTIYTGRLINAKQYHFKIRQHIYMTGEDPPPPPPSVAPPLPQSVKKIRFLYFVLLSPFPFRIGNDNPNKNLRKMICEMTDEGKNVYHFFSGKPGGCPPGGCH